MGKEGGEKNENLSHDHKIRVTSKFHLKYNFGAHFNAHAWEKFPWKAIKYKIKEKKMRVDKARKKLHLTQILKVNVLVQPNFQCCGRAPCKSFRVQSMSSPGEDLNSKAMGKTVAWWNPGEWLPVSRKSQFCWPWWTLGLIQQKADFDVPKKRWPLFCSFVVQWGFFLVLVIIEPDQIHPISTLLNCTHIFNPTPKFSFQHWVDRVHEREGVLAACPVPFSSLPFPLRPSSDYCSLPRSSSWQPCNPLLFLTIWWSWCCLS